MINQINSGLPNARASLAFLIPRGSRGGGSSLFIHAVRWHECPRIHMEPTSTLLDCPSNNKGVDVMGKGLLLWLVGVPIPVIIILWLLFFR